MEENPQNAPSMQEGRPIELKHAIAFCAIVVTLIACFPLIRAGYAVPDDFQSYLWANSPDKWLIPWTTSQYLGRLHGFHILLDYVPHIVDSRIFAKAIQIGSLIATAMLFAYAVARYSGDAYWGLVVALLFGGFMQNMWEHHIYAAYPFVFQCGGFFLILSLLAFRESVHTNTPRNQLATGVCFFLSLLCYEAFVLYLVLYFLIALQCRAPQGAKAVLIPLRPVIVATGSYLTIYLAWRYVYPPTYAGSQLSEEFDLLRTWKVVWQFSWASLPGYVYMHFTDIHARFAESPEGFRRTFEYFFANLQVEWVIKALGVGTGLWLSQYASAEWSGWRRLRGVMVVSALLFFLPAIPLGLTYKYQEWVIAGGAQAYVSTYFSYFGVVLLLSTVVAGIRAIPMGGRARKAGMFVCVVLAAVLSLVTDYGNSAMHRSQALYHERWRLFDEIVTSKDFEQVPAESCILIDGLSVALVFGSVDQFYWGENVKHKTGKSLKVMDGRKRFRDCLSDGKTQGFIVRYRQEDNVRNQFIMLSRVAKHEGKMVGENVVLLTSGQSRRFLLLVESESKWEGVSELGVDGIVAVRERQFNAYLIDKTRQRWGTLRTEISMSGMLLDTLSVNFLAD